MVTSQITLLPDDCYHLPVTSSDGHFNLEKIDNFFEKKSYYWNFGNFFKKSIYINLALVTIT